MLVRQRKPTRLQASSPFPSLAIARKTSFRSFRPCFETSSDGVPSSRNLYPRGFVSCSPSTSPASRSGKWWERRKAPVLCLRLGGVAIPVEPREARLPVGWPFRARGLPFELRDGMRTLQRVGDRSSLSRVLAAMTGRPMSRREAQTRRVLPAMGSGGSRRNLPPPRGCE